MPKIGPENMSQEEQDKLVDDALLWLAENLTELKHQDPITDDILFSLISLPITGWIEQLVNIILNVAKQQSDQLYMSYRIMAMKWFQTILGGVGGTVRLLSNLSTATLLRDLRDDPTKLDQYLEEWAPVLDAGLSAPEFWKEFHERAQSLTDEEVTTRLMASAMQDIATNVENPDADKPVLH